MTDKKLVLLGIIAVVMVALAVITSSVPENKAIKVVEPTYLVQGVDPDNIGSILVKSGDKTVTLKRKNGSFVVDEKSGYPALASKINDLLGNVLDVQTEEMFTDNASNHADLGVTEETGAYVVKFFKPDGSELTGIIVGKEKEGGQGTFVRRTSDDKVYLTLDRLYLPSSPINYVEQNLLSVDKEAVKWVKVSDKQAGEYTLNKDGDNVVFADQPEDKTLKDAEAKKVFNALGSLRFDDVFKEGQIAVVFDKKYVCMLDDTTQYTLDVAVDGDDTYIKINSEYTDPAKVTVTRGGNETEEELKAKEDKLLSRDNAVKFAAEHNGWVYKLSSYVADNLKKSATDLLEDKLKPEPKEEVKKAEEPA